MDEVGSCAEEAAGRSSSETSSRVNPATIWRRSRSAAGGSTGSPVERGSTFPSQRRYGRRRCKPPLDRLALLETEAARVDRDHLPRAEPSAPSPRAGRQGDGARLRGAGHEPVVGHGVAQRPQPVAVERGSDDAAVSEHDCRRAVPGLHERGVVAIEVADGGIARGVGFPGFRQEHRRRVTHVAAAADEQLERVVQERRVRATRLERLQPACAQPVDVAVDRVDLAVVAEEAERLGALPRRLGVGREALVEDRERDGEGFVTEIRVERRELSGRAERLVGDGAERQRADVDAGVVREPLLRSERALLGVFRVRAVRSLHDELLDRGNARRGRLPERARVDRNGPPADDPEALGGARLLDAAARAVLAQEDHRQSAPRPRNERRGERKQDSGAVPGQAVGRDGATVTHAAQPLERGVEDRPRRAAAESRRRSRCHRSRVRRARGTAEAPSRKEMDRSRLLRLT